MKRIIHFEKYQICPTAYTFKTSRFGVTKCNMIHFFRKSMTRTTGTKICFSGISESPRKNSCRQFGHPLLASTSHGACHIAVQIMVFNALSAGVSTGEKGQLKALNQLFRQEDKLQGNSCHAYDAREEILNKKRKAFSFP